MSRRPLVPVLGLAIGDYLLWNWSLNGSHDVLALVSGLTLPPLAVACIWLLVLSVADLVAATILRPSAGAGRANRRKHSQQGRPAGTGAALDGAEAQAAQARAASRKLAA